MVRPYFNRKAGQRVYERFLKVLPKLTDEELIEKSRYYNILSYDDGDYHDSNHHRMCGACFNEAQRRGKPELYLDILKALLDDIDGPLWNLGTKSREYRHNYYRRHKAAKQERS